MRNCPIGFNELQLVQLLSLLEGDSYALVINGLVWENQEGLSDGAEVLYACPVKEAPYYFLDLFDFGSNVDGSYFVYFNQFVSYV